MEKSNAKRLLTSYTSECGLVRYNYAHLTVLVIEASCKSVSKKFLNVFCVISEK